MGPISTGPTIHIIKLLERRGAGTQRLAQTNVSHILIRPSEIVTSEQARSQAQEIYERLKAGETLPHWQKSFQKTLPAR